MHDLKFHRRAICCGILTFGHLTHDQVMVARRGVYLGGLIRSEKLIYLKAPARVCLVSWGAVMVADRAG